MSTDKCIFSIPVFDPYELEDCESGHESESERTDRLNDEAESEAEDIAWRIHWLSTVDEELEIFTNEQKQ